MRACLSLHWVSAISAFTKEYSSPFQTKPGGRVMLQAIQATSWMLFKGNPNFQASSVSFGKIPAATRWSRTSAPSPQRLVKAQTAWLAVVLLSDPTSAMSFGMAPAWMTALDCTVVPDAIFERIQSVSNLTVTLLRIGKMPQFIAKCNSFLHTLNDQADRWTLESNPIAQLQRLVDCLELTACAHRQALWVCRHHRKFSVLD